MTERRAMVGADETGPSIRRQCELLRVCRSAILYVPKGPDKDELLLIRRMDELHLRYPFYGSRMLARFLRSEGWEVNRKRIQRLMREMGIESMAPKPNTSEPHPEHAVYPYLLRNLDICSVNQVWATDITYIPMKSGWLYLCAVMDWYSRRVLSWRLSNSLDSRFCVDALEEALDHFGPPQIFNTDQGAQFTSDAFTGVLRAHGIAISMDGRGRYLDNIFVERLWRSLKYENVYLYDYETPKSAREGIGSYLVFYNDERPHQSLGYQTPKAFYERSQKATKAAS